VSCFLRAEGPSSSLTTAVSRLQFRFRMSRLREMVHQRDREDAARVIQCTWRRRTAVCHFRRSLVNGRRDSAARAIQDAFRDMLSHRRRAEVLETAAP